MNLWLNSALELRCIDMPFFVRRHFGLVPGLRSADAHPVLLIPHAVARAPFPYLLGIRARRALPTRRCLLFPTRHRSPCSWRCFGWKIPFCVPHTIMQLMWRPGATKLMFLVPNAIAAAPLPHLTRICRGRASAARLSAFFPARNQTRLWFWDAVLSIFFCKALVVVVIPRGFVTTTFRTFIPYAIASAPFPDLLWILTRWALRARCSFLLRAACNVTIAESKSQESNCIS